MKQKQAENEPDLVDTLRQWQLIEDEQKHDRLLAQLEDFKRGIYPYA